MTSISTRSAPLPHHRLGRQLHAEWARLRNDPTALRRARTWQIVEGRLDSLDDVLAAVGFDRPASAATERCLRHLVLQARTDELAAQVVVQRLLPGALSVANRRRRNGNGDDAAVELLGALWIAVRTFDPTRRPASLAAALLADADYRAFRAEWRRRAGREPSEQLPAELAQPDPCADPATELAELLREAKGAELVTGDELALLRHLLADPSPTRVASRLDLNERTIRNRRDRLTAKLRALALAA
jgi:DNA-directed RNA polymerase specialized sigma24 family protein